MAWTGSYEELEAYLREFVNFRGDPVPYDYGGVVQLWLALLDNLRKNALEGELEELGECLTEEQSRFLLQIAGYLRWESHD